MSLLDLSQSIVNHLNRIDIGAGWRVEPHPHLDDNDQPWLRIFSESMRLNYPRGGRNDFPAIWFEIKCVHKRYPHDAMGPYKISIVLDNGHLDAHPDYLTVMAANITDKINILGEWGQHILAGIETYQGNNSYRELNPKLIFDDTYIDTGVGYILMQKFMF